VSSATLSGESTPCELVAGDSRSEVGPTLAAPVPYIVIAGAIIGIDPLVRGRVSARRRG